MTTLEQYAAFSLLLGLTVALAFALSAIIMMLSLYGFHPTPETFF